MGGWVSKPAPSIPPPRKLLSPEEWPYGRDDADGMTIVMADDGCDNAAFDGDGRRDGDDDNIGDDGDDDDGLR